MAEATPPDWRDTCEHCGHTFDAGEPRWLEQRRYFVHTECARWELWGRPPYLWKLKELRKRYRDAGADERRGLVRAARAIREMKGAWPVNAAEHVNRVLEAVRSVG
jgi:hypothetical protein